MNVKTFVKVHMHVCAILILIRVCDAYLYVCAYLSMYVRRWCVYACLSAYLTHTCMRVCLPLCACDTHMCVYAYLSAYTTQTHAHALTSVHNRSTIPDRGP